MHQFVTSVSLKISVEDPDSKEKHHFAGSGSKLSSTDPNLIIGNLKKENNKLVLIKTH